MLCLTLAKPFLLCIVSGCELLINVLQLTIANFWPLHIISGCERAAIQHHLRFANPCYFVSSQLVSLVLDGVSQR